MLESLNEYEVNLRQDHAIDKYRDVILNLSVFEDKNEYQLRMTPIQAENLAKDLLRLILEARDLKDDKTKNM